MKLILCRPGSSLNSKHVSCLVQFIQQACRDGIQIIDSPAESCNIYYVRNKCLGADLMRGVKQKPFNGKIKYDYMLWLDSDMIFSYNQFLALLSRKKDIVSGLYAYEGGQGYTAGFRDENYLRRHGFYSHLTPASVISCKGLIDVDYIGFGFVLIKCGVFEAMDYPWFRPVFTTFQSGTLTISDFSMEDVGWSMYAQNVGFRIYVDPSVVVGHEKSKVY